MTLLGRGFHLVVSLGLIICVVALYVVPVVYWSLGLAPTSPDGIDVWAVYRSLIVDTLMLSSGAAAMAVFLGATMACIAVFSSRLVGTVLTVAMTVPLLVGFVARNYSWVGLLSQVTADASHDNLVGKLALSLLDHRLGVIVVMGSVFVPFCYFICFQGFSSLRPISFQAARALGASDLRMFWTITIPTARRSLALSFTLSVVLGVGYFITPQLVGGGNFDFVGNGVLRLLNDLGKTAEASLLAVYLLLTAVIPILGIIGIAGYSEYHRSRLVAQARARASSGTITTVAIPETEHSP